MGGSFCMSALTYSAASGPFAASKLMSKFTPDCVSSNLMMGTFALAMICAEAHNAGQGLRHDIYTTSKAF